MGSLIEGLGMFEHGSLTKDLDEALYGELTYFASFGEAPGRMRLIIDTWGWLAALWVPAPLAPGERNTGRTSLRIRDRILGPEH